ncbi:MAG: xanthine dehydrogenase small subunit [Bacteroidota bacterium]
MRNEIKFVLDGKITKLTFSDELKPTTTVLNYLRKNPCHKGVKEGCAEGDCGACTIVLGELNKDKIKYKAIDSCLVFLPMLHGKQLITVENLSQKEKLHPVQESLVNCNGSQCGYCTPGIVMSLFSLYKNENNPSKEVVEDALTGNLCRCTGYKPIIESAFLSCNKNGKDIFSDSENEVVAQLKVIQKEENSIEIETENQHYYQPSTKEEALAIRYKKQDAVMISGATDVALRVTKRHELLTEIIDLSHVEDLKDCSISDYHIKFGAGMTLEDVKVVAENELPALYETLKVFGSKQIRCLATFGGNLGSSSPIGDTLPTLMAYNAEIKLQSVEGERRVNMNNFVLGYRQTERKPSELITKIIIPKPAANTQVKFYKVSKRKDLDISTVSGGFSVTLENGCVMAITLAYGGMAAVTKRAAKAEHYLTGKSWSREHVEHAMQLVADDFTPISDARSGAEFRTLAAKNLLLKFWVETNV